MPQGVDLGAGYKTNVAYSTFVDYIAEDLQRDLSQMLWAHRFFSLQMDGCPNNANIAYSSTSTTRRQGRFLAIQ